jgi:hypothetical protein
MPFFGRPRSDGDGGNRTDQEKTDAENKRRAAIILPNIMANPEFWKLVFDVKFLKVEDLDRRSSKDPLVLTAKAGEVPPSINLNDIMQLQSENLDTNTIAFLIDRPTSSQFLKWRASIVDFFRGDLPYDDTPENTKAIIESIIDRNGALTSFRELAIPDTNPQTESDKDAMYDYSDDEEWLKQAAVTLQTIFATINSILSASNIDKNELEKLIIQLLEITPNFHDLFPASSNDTTLQQYQNRTVALLQRKDLSKFQRSNHITFNNTNLIDATNPEIRKRFFKRTLDFASKAESSAYIPSFVEYRKWIHKNLPQIIAQKQLVDEYLMIRDLSEKFIKHFQQSLYPQQMKQTRYQRLLKSVQVFCNEIQNLLLQHPPLNEEFNKQPSKEDLLAIALFPESKLNEFIKGCVAYKARDVAIELLHVVTNTRESLRETLPELKVDRRELNGEELISNINSLMAKFSLYLDQLDKALDGDTEETIKNVAKAAYMANLCYSLLVSRVNMKPNTANTDEATKEEVKQLQTKISALLNSDKFKNLPARANFLQSSNIEMLFRSVSTTLGMPQRRSFSYSKG